MKKLLRIISALTTIVVIGTCLVSCGKSDSEIQKEIEAAFTSVIEAFKSGDSESIKNFCISPDTLGDETEIKSAVLDSLGNISCTVNSVTVNDSKNVTINADITMIDTSKIMEEYINNIVALVSSAEYQSKLETMTREEYQSLMNDELKKVLSGDDIPTVTNNIDVTMRLDGNTWKLNGSELTDLLINNTVNAVNQIKQ